MKWHVITVIGENMLDDEQILLKTANLLDTLQEKCWDGYKQAGMKKKSGKNVPNCVPVSEKVLREVTEDEMRALEDVLDDLDPANLPLNDLFSGKMRTVIPFPTIDPSTELGKFAEFFKSQEYDVDWEKGMVYAERDLRKSDDFLDMLGGGPEPKKKTKKIQMKIGKLFSKLADLSRRKDEIYQKVYDHLDGIGYKLADGEPVRTSRRVTGKMMKAALDEKEYENFQRINGQIYLYVVNPGVAGPAGYDLTDLATQYGEYWKKNAGYIKKEINNIDDNKFSIIITRHPIDVLRMSDFDEITSCHSPASRASAYQSYYKCAVAEAQGHGAVAYVVKTEELLSATNTGNIDSAEQEIQEGEIFADDKRPFTGDIEPVSRTRIRHVRYYEGDEPPKRYDDGQDVGMPEKRVYGADIPGLANQVTDWARSNQEEVIQNMPKEGDKIDLSKFMIFGGSYEDTADASGRAILMKQLLGDKNVEFAGAMRQNKDTEETLDADLIGDVIAQYNGQCEEIMNEWNNKMAQTYVDYEVGDDGGEGAYIKPFAAFVAKWNVDDWKRLPSNAEEVVWNSVDEINERNGYGDIFVPSNHDTPTIRRVRDEIHLSIQVNFEHPKIYGGSYMALTEEYNEACQAIDTIIDDHRDAWEEMLTTYFKREGQMEGGEYANLAVAIEDGILTSYEWDLESDGEYYESYESTARYSHYYDPEDLGLSMEVLMQILDSRDFKIELRKQLLEAPRKEQNTQYYLQMNATTVEHAGEAKYTAIFSINADEPDIMTGLFVELVEGEMDDEDNLNVVFNRVLAQFVNARQPSHMQTNESIVKSWKGFLSG
tara:strand:+ start:5467 stop:7941 length:2475 start_codon:yes stop_codon:yes gene_type:complete